MTAIRKTTLQVAYFQVFTNLTTELYTSNDRFGFNILLFFIHAKMPAGCRMKKTTQTLRRAESGFL